MTPEQQTAATDNALVEKLVATRPEAIWRDVITQVLINPDGPEAAERIKSLLAEVERLQQEIVEIGPSPYCDQCGSCGDGGCGCTHKCKYAFDHPEVESHIEVLEADRQRMREALEKLAYVLVEDANGIPTHYAIKAEHRDAALNPASKEANDG